MCVRGVGLNRVCCQWKKISWSQGGHVGDGVSLWKEGVRERFWIEGWSQRQRELCGSGSRRNT